MRKKFALLRNKKGNPVFANTSGYFQYDEGKHEILFESDNLIDCYDHLLSCHYYRKGYPVYRPHLIGFTETKSRPNQFNVLNPSHIKRERVRSDKPRNLPFVCAG
jgi:hypothetical protein